MSRFNLNFQQYKEEQASVHKSNACKHFYGKY